MITFKPALTQGFLIKRYKRFLADVTLDNGQIVTAHCANSGSMMGLAAPGSRVWLSPNTNPKAKLDWRWELVEADGTLVGINTSRPNAIVEAALLAGQIPALAGFAALKREVKYGNNSRVDILLTGAQGDLTYVEVKNVTLRRGQAALFPDAVTARGRKHLQELQDMVAAGHKAVMFYLVNRSDCQYVAPADDIDPAYGAALRGAAAAGVEMLAYQADVTSSGICLSDTLSIRL